MTFSTCPNHHIRSRLHSCVLSRFSLVRLFVTVWTIARQTPRPSTHRILWAWILEWVAMSSSRGSPWPRNGALISDISCTGRWVLYHWHRLGSPKLSARVARRPLRASPHRERPDGCSFPGEWVHVPLKTGAVGRSQKLHSPLCSGAGVLWVVRSWWNSHLAWAPPRSPPGEDAVPLSCLSNQSPGKDKHLFSSKPLFSNILYFKVCIPYLMEKPQ